MHSKFLMKTTDGRFKKMDFLRFAVFLSFTGTQMRGKKQIRRSLDDYSIKQCGYGVPQKL